MEGVVGSQSAVPCGHVRSDALRTRADHDGGRYDFPLCDWRNTRALRLAKQAAGDKDIKIGGGVSTLRQYLEAGWVDSLHFALAPVVLGRGEALFTGLDLHGLGFSMTHRKATEQATHLVLEKAKT
jgi:dihydrofolate reductase